MKQVVTFIFTLGMILSSFAGPGCQDKAGGDPVGELLQYVGCKESKGGIGDCLEYHYDGRKLVIKHVNAGFNCCPGTLTADIVVQSGIISINEREQEAGCYCLCLYDLDMEIDRLEPGEYTIRVAEPYIDDGDELLEFNVHLISGASGRYCVERDYYPWIH